MNENEQPRKNFDKQKQKSKKASNIKRFEQLEFKDDFMFGLIMRNPKYCKPFLETILDIKISGIHYPKAQKSIDITANAKSVRLNILEKGADYKNLKRSFVIFICTFDLFGEGRHIYTFENRCIQNTNLTLGDETIKIILNTKGTMNDVNPEMKQLLEYIDGREASNEFTRELETAVKTAKNNDRWRVEYMTLEMRYRELLEQGHEEGLEQGLEEGLEQGLAQGLEQGLEQTATRMLQSGELPVEKIAFYSGLSVEKVLELKNRLFE